MNTDNKSKTIDKIVIGFPVCGHPYIKNLINRAESQGSKIHITDKFVEISGEKLEMYLGELEQHIETLDKNKWDELCESCGVSDEIKDMVIFDES